MNTSSHQPDDSILAEQRSDETNLTTEDTVDRLDESMVEMYKQFLPIILVTCLFALVLNSAILAAILCSKNLLGFKSSRGYLPTVTSLVCADTLTSLLLGIQLFCGSYLPVVMNIIPPPCLMLPLECVRLGAVVTTVLHLLVLSLLHTATVAAPIRLKKVLTVRILGLVLALLWAVPTLITTVLFFSVPDQLFSSESCSNYTLLQSFLFRSAFTSVIFVPIIIISINYGFFYYLLSKRFRIRNANGGYRTCSRVSAGVSKQNRHAAGVTFLVLLSCTVCWVPVSVSHLLICPIGCYWSPTDLPLKVNFFVHGVSNFLLVTKSLVNPLIFALRQRQIRNALSRIVRCLDPEEEDRKHRQRSVTKYSYVSRYSRNRIT